MARAHTWTGRRLTPDERQWAAMSLRDGAEVEALAAALRCSRKTVWRVRSEWALRRRSEARSELRLAFDEREEIRAGLAAGKSFQQIGRELGRSASTISREVGGKEGKTSYRALTAERRACECRRRPKPTKLSQSPGLCKAVEEGLEQSWSPQQISARLRVSHPDDEEMRISHETIYKALYVQGKGELRRQLARKLRTGRTRRRPRRSARSEQGKITGMVPIADRPPEADDRAVPGHWEGDLLMGAQNRSAVATLVERRTRYVMLAYLGGEHTTERVTGALAKRITELPDHLVRSLAWDQGKELAAHRRFTDKTGIDVYFCDPHSPWQRGTNENTNGLLRQYMPKGTDLSQHSQADLDSISQELNGRPRKTLGWATPAEKMEELLR